MGNHCLTPLDRLRHKHEFERVFQQGTKQVSAAFVLYLLPTSGPRSRMGLAVSKRVGGAVVRNRIKRYTREFFRQHKTEFDPHCDVVVVARHRAATIAYAESTKQFLFLLRRYRQVQIERAN